MKLWDWLVKLTISLNIWSPPKAPSTLVYISGYTGDGPRDAKGIYVFTLDETTPKLVPVGLAAEITNASYTVIHPSHKYLYAVSEVDDGSISSFEIDLAEPRRLRFINKQSSRGSGPCYLSTNRAGDYLFVANYNNATVAVLPIDIQNGSLRSNTGFDQQTGKSVDPVRQTTAHAHSILLDKREEFALSGDLGSDQIYHYKFFAHNGSIERSAITKAAKPGDGPRHIIFSANERFVYVMNELKSEITVFNYLPTMEPIQSISTIPENFTSLNTGAELLLHPVTQRYLYASNRGHDSIAVFLVNESSGYLTLIQHISVQGQTPRNFNITPNGKFLIVSNQNSRNVVLFTIEEQTGKLMPTGSSVEVANATCVKILVQ